MLFIVLGTLPSGGASSDDRARGSSADVAVLSKSSVPLVTVRSPVREGQIHSPTVITTSTADAPYEEVNKGHNLVRAMVGLHVVYIDVSLQSATLRFSSGDVEKFRTLISAAAAARG